MNDEQVRTRLHEMAAGWQVPTFEIADLTELSRARRHRARLALLATVTAALAAAGVGATTWIVTTDQPGHETGATKPVSSASSPVTGTRPFFPAPVRVLPVTHRHDRLRDGRRVLARGRAGVPRPLLVAARLSFTERRPVTVAAAMLILTKPGTGVSVGGASLDSDYKADHAEITHGPIIRATSPNPAHLTITTPQLLPPGIYPVMYVYRTSGKAVENGGTYDPATSGGRLGVIVIK